MGTAKGKGKKQRSVPARGKTLTDAQVRKLRRLWTKDKMSVTAVAKEMKLSRNTVQKRVQQLRSHGVIGGPRAVTMKRRVLTAGLAVEKRVMRVKVLRARPNKGVRVEQPRRTMRIPTAQLNAMVRRRKAHRETGLRTTQRDVAFAGARAVVRATEKLLRIRRGAGAVAAAAAVVRARAGQRGREVCLRQASSR